MEVRLVDRGWGAELEACRAMHPDGLLIVCPFIKAGVVDRLLGNVVPADLRVVTRFDLKGFAAGVSDIAALGRVMAAGGQVRGVHGLHAKVFVFGTEAAVVTSANLTHRGLNANAEFGCVSVLPEFVTACRTYFEDLWSRSGSNLSANQLHAWSEEVDRVLATGARPDRRLALPDYGIQLDQDPAAESAGVITDDLHVAPQWVAEALRGHLKFFGEGHNRAEWSMEVLDEVRRSGSHWACTYPMGSGRPRQVGDGDVMYLGRMVRQPNDTLIYGRAVGRQHRDDEDVASSEEIALRQWKQRWPYYIRVHDPEFLAGSLGNGIRMSELFDELGLDALASTQANAHKGLGNADPRHAIRQQAAARLSSEGLRWLNERFGVALARYGAVPADELNALDWPKVR